MNDTTLRRIIAVAFAFSGFSALAYQIAWQRVLTQVIGSDAISVVLVVMIFMFCLGVGAELARRLLARPGIRLAPTYAVIELAIGAYGIVSIPILRAANGWWATLGVHSVVLDSVLNLLLLAVPVIGMGMTTPLIVQLAKRRIEDLGKVVGTLYGLNILGAAFGALLTGLVLIETLGLQGTTVVAAAVNLAIGATLFALLKSTPPVQNTSNSIESTSTTWRTAGAAIAFGFGTLALQMLLFRVLANYFTMATIVFPILLFAYLLLMATGQVVGGRLADRFPASLPGVLAALFLVGSLLLLAALRFPPTWAASFGALYFTSFNGSLVGTDYPQLVKDPNPLVIALFGGAMMLSVVAWSALFPVMLRVLTDRIENAGRSFARLYTLYTTGNVLGTLAVGLYLLAEIGTGPSAMVTIAIVALGTFLALTHAERFPIVTTIIGLASALLIPLNYYQQFRLGNYSVSSVYEGRNGVVTTVPTQTFYEIVDMNRTASASAIVRNPEEPQSQYEAWRWNHSELMALDPSFRPKNVLIIGIGHAYLIDALLDLPSIEKIVVVDISAEVIDAVRDKTATSTKRIFSDPRVEIIVADGRRYVQQALAEGRRFDLIQTKINEPWHAGAGNLFTVEFMRMERDLLAPDGYLGVRPLAGHVRDGLQVFDAAIYPGYYHVFFKNGVLPPLKEAVVDQGIAEAWSKELPGHDKTDVRASALDVWVFHRGDLDAFDGNTDDRPLFEYFWWRQIMGRWVSPRVPLSDPRFEKQKVIIPVRQVQD
ncbi:Polyamine aminopropyltransferase [Mycolicibacterium aubagnense]